MAALPLAASLVAVMVAEPWVTPVASPLGETVATLRSLLVHVTGRPCSGLPSGFLGVAVSCSVSPTGMLLDEGQTNTAATGTTVTPIAAVPLAPSLVAVIVAEPGATPVTSPPLETVATSGVLLSQVTGRPVSGLPAPSFRVRVSWIVSPTRSVPDGGVTTTEATADDVGAAG